MRPRDQVKDAHEDAVIAQFVERLNNQSGKRYQVISKPEPPDAVLKCDGEYKWLEHADVYRSAEEAHEERSAVTPGELKHIHSEHPITETDERLASALCVMLQKKLSMGSYSEPYGKYGPGILLLTERDALFNKSTLQCICDRLQDCKYPNDKGFFAKVYLGVRSKDGLAFVRLYPTVESPHSN